MKYKRVYRLLLVMLALSILVFPGMAFAQTLNGNTAPFVASVANSLVDEDDMLTIQIPPKAFPHDFTLRVIKQDPASVKAPEGYVVSKAADLSFTSSRGNKEVNSMVPIRVMYYFDDLDYKRACQMDTTQPLGKFHLGSYNEVEQKWVMLPTTIFWNGQNGVIEATANMGSAKYALFWNPEAQGTQLSPMGDDTLRLFANYSRVFSKVDPFIVQGRTMVPLGVISQNMGAQVKWFSDDKRIEIISNKGNQVTIWIDNTMGLRDGKTVTLQVAPMLVGGRTFVPLSFVGTAIGAEVNWDSLSHSVFVTQ